MTDLATHVPISIPIGRKLKTYTLAEYLQREAKSIDKNEFINFVIELLMENIYENVEV
jgi:hypothetical protein